MADFIVFNEGSKFVVDNTHGLPATCFFLLSTKDTATHLITDTLAVGVGEITGTGYARKSQAAPVGSGNPTAYVFTLMSWLTGAATDWPASVKSVVLATTVDNTGKAICAWNLQVGGAARNLAGANTTENFTPTLTAGS